ncbi:MAG: hypothetical protein K2W95_30745 [Candidatus Obscuribacterales bacterium]|nr:hypothetical protein [Candidatus Obscuribacterales bacterium]
MFKDLIVSFLIVLLVACLLNSIGIALGVVQGYMPYPWPSAINGVSEAKGGFGMKRDDLIYPEIHFTEKDRTVQYMTGISDGKERANVEFPLGANN